MENYIVRIYRRDEYNPDGLAGIVEFVETGEKRPFHRLTDLLAALQQPSLAQPSAQVA